MRGGEAEREAETDERNVGTLRTDDLLEDSQPHLFIRRYEQKPQTVKSMLNKQLL